MTRHAQQERHALCTTLLQVGPEAPTLCSPWLARDLAAHLVIRDSRPDLSLGMFVPPLRDRLDSAMRDKANGDWEGLVAEVRHGPPAWSPARLGPVDETVNTVEFFVHHEDVLRGTPDAAHRHLDLGLERGLWKLLRSSSKLMFRRSEVGVVLVAEGYGRYAVKGPGGPGTVVLRGRPGELLLFSYGRSRAADVTLEGPDEAVAAIRGARIGLG